jgi:quinoprotein glucose dehydrogenase
VRALDANTGKILWVQEVGAALEGMPVLYEINGKQYLVFCAAARATTRTHSIPAHPASQAPIDGAYVASALDSVSRAAAKKK